MFMQNLTKPWEPRHLAKHYSKHVLCFWMRVLLELGHKAKHIAFLDVVLIYSAEDMSTPKRSEWSMGLP